MCALVGVDPASVMAAGPHERDLLLRVAEEALEIRKKAASG